jgi:hypothetical protein
MGKANVGGRGKVRTFGCLKNEYDSGFILEYATLFVLGAGQAHLFIGKL